MVIQAWVKPQLKGGGQGITTGFTRPAATSGVRPTGLTYAKGFPAPIARPTGLTYGNGATATGGKGAGGQRFTVVKQQDAPIDTTARYTGTVSKYDHRRGFGFIAVAQPGVVKNDSLYVHWKNIQTEDRFPSLTKGMEVEFGILKSTSFGVKAKTLTLPGGGLIAIQQDMDEKDKQFVGGPQTRYTGTLKFYSPIKGFGWVKLDEGFAFNEAVPKELRVNKWEMNAGGKNPLKAKDISVEFGIVKSKRGDFVAYNMTLPGGIAMSQEGLEGRRSSGGRKYQGEVMLWNYFKGYGYIKLDGSAMLPPQVTQKMQQMNQSAQAKGKKTEDRTLYFRKQDVVQGVRLEKGQRVTFQVYTDDRGAGAFEIV